MVGCNVGEQIQGRSVSGAMWFGTITDEFWISTCLQGEAGLQCVRTVKSKHKWGCQLTISSKYVQTALVFENGFSSFHSSYLHMIDLSEGSTLKQVFKIQYSCNKYCWVNLRTDKYSSQKIITLYQVVMPSQDFSMWSMAQLAINNLF